MTSSLNLEALRGMYCVQVVLILADSLRKKKR